MSDINELIMKQLDKMDSKLEKLDAKVDNMSTVHIKNTAVLEEHERRSTASETRISTLEEKEQKRAERISKLKGFFMYTGILAAAASGLVYFLLNVTELIKNLRH